MTEPPKPLIERYYLALGRFIDRFTELERGLFELLATSSGTGYIQGRAVFSGSRAEVLVSLIRRSYEAAERDIEPLLERALRQASLLNSARNDVVHLDKTDIGLPDVVWASNDNRQMQSRVKETTVGPAMLAAMTEDMEIIQMALKVAQVELLGGGMPERVDEAKRFAQQPWRYKQPPPASPRRANQGRPQGHGGQRKPSER